MSKVKGQPVRRTKLYAVWTSMKQRCLNTRCDVYDNYGGRGITITKRWLDFHKFKADMGECPPGLTLERKNNDRGYSKRNCKWATRVRQNRNHRGNVRLTYKRKTKLMVEWAEHFEIEQHVLRSRLVRAQWNVAKVFNRMV